MKKTIQKSLSSLQSKSITFCYENKSDIPKQKLCQPSITPRTGSMEQDLQVFEKVASTPISADAVISTDVSDSSIITNTEEIIAEEDFAQDFTGFTGNDFVEQINVFFGFDKK